MVIVTCPECWSNKVKDVDYEDSREDNFKCCDCGHAFSIEQASWDTGD